MQNITELPQILFYLGQNYNYWLESFSAPEAKIIGDGALARCHALLEINLPKATNIGIGVFDDCVALKILKLGGTNVTVNTNSFYDLTTGQIDLYLSTTEMQSGSVNGKQWTKGTRTWTFKSIKQIL